MVGEAIISMIENSREPVSASKISSRLGVSGIKIREVVNQARREGLPICSCHKGYYISDDKQEIEKTIKSLAHRAESMMTAAQGLSTCLGGD